MNRFYKPSALIFLGLLSFLSPDLHAQWRQTGADIDGEGDGDQSGRSVSISADGTIVAIGADFNFNGGFVRGQVRVYKNIGGTWIQQGSDIDGEADGDRSGLFVSLSADGSTVAIGAPNNDGVGTQRGHVRVYKRTGGTWIQQGGDIEGEADNDLSGWSVSLSADGSTVAIGAPNNDGVGTQRGHVRVYKRTGGTWIQQGGDIEGEADNDLSGWSVLFPLMAVRWPLERPIMTGVGDMCGYIKI